VLTSAIADTAILVHGSGDISESSFVSRRRSPIGSLAYDPFTNISYCLSHDHFLAQTEAGEFTKIKSFYK
jgi:hypothetical protein